jgi:hypothetical protein
VPKLGVQKLDPSALMPYQNLILDIGHPRISENFHCLDEDIPDKNAIQRWVQQLHKAKMLFVGTAPSLQV